MYKIEIEDKFEAAHFLREYIGQCSELHGHRWLWSTAIGAKELNPLGMVIDFSEIKRCIRDKFDHKCINSVEPFNITNPTAENIAYDICDMIERRITDSTKGLKVLYVTVYESEKCSATYIPD
jgi:6-pyruvoyltetrahydropterin/6-carboxytetrahydropterin synthase